MRDDIKDVIKKIKKLAEQGSAGERESARNMLETMIKAYNLEDEDLYDDDHVDKIQFRYTNKYEYRLLVQTITNVLGNVNMYEYEDHRKHLVITYGRKIDEVNIDIRYQFYKNLWYKELDFMIKAFIVKHSIFPKYDSPQLEDGEEDEDSPENLSLEEIIKLKTMMAAMYDDQYSPSLEEHN